MTDTVIIEARALTRIYLLGDTQVTGLDGVDLTVGRGELLVVKGDSGSGKSTLLALLSGLDRPSRGRLEVAGYALDHKGADLTRFRRRIVGMVFQTFNLLPTLTVTENILLPALLAGRNAGRARQRALELVRQFNLVRRSEHRPAQLSGGEMQRTAIARALINEPQIVLADEPTGNLDSRNGRMVIDLLSDLRRRRQRTVVIATHSGLADALADRIVHLKDGRITG